MKRVLILGTNAGQADIIDYLNKAGWETHVCGHKRVGPGCDLAYKFHIASTIDAEAVKQVAEEIKPDIIYSVSSDSAIRTATKVSEDLGLPVLVGSDIIELFHHKERLRKFLESNDISTVKYLTLTDPNQKIFWDTYPCVVKPSDSQGQRGVQLVRDRESLEEAIKFAFEQSSSNTVIIEEYLTGIEISTNVIVQNRKIIVNEFSERLIFGPEFFGLPKGHTIPIQNLSEKLVEQSSEVVVELIEKLGIENAVLYIQMKVSERGPKIIEIAPRLDGCHIWRVIKHFKGYDLRKYAIDCLIGNPIVHKEKKDPVGYSTLQFHHLPTGAEFLKEKLSLPKDTVFNEYRYHDGDIVQPINGRLEVAGYYIFDVKK